MQRVTKVYENVTAAMTEACKIRTEERRHVFYSDNLEGRTWSRCIRDAVRAYPEGAETVRTLRDCVTGDVRPVVPHRTRQWAEDTGDEVCIDRLRSGAPYWRTVTKTPVTGVQKVILCANVASDSSIENVDVFWRGAVALALTDFLEYQGYRVQYWVFRRSGEAYVDGRDQTLAVRLKDFRDPVDVGRIAVGVSGWFYRSIMFQLQGRGATDTMGLAQPLDPAECALLTGSRPDETVLVVPEVFDEEAARAALASLVEELT